MQKSPWKQFGLNCTWQKKEAIHCCCIQALATLCLFLSGFSGKSAFFYAFAMRPEAPTGVRETLHRWIFLCAAIKRPSGFRQETSFWSWGQHQFRHKLPSNHSYRLLLTHSSQSAKKSKHNSQQVRKFLIILGKLSKMRTNSDLWIFGAKNSNMCPCFAGKCYQMRLFDWFSKHCLEMLRIPGWEVVSFMTLVWTKPSTMIWWLFCFYVRHHE